MMAMVVGVMLVPPLANQCLSYEPRQSSEAVQSDWWNSSFEYRRQLHFDAPEPEGFVHIDVQGLGPHLSSIRIVENDAVLPYYIQSDVPIVGVTRVWFQPSDLEIFLYYGNDSVDYDAALLDEYPVDIVSWYSFEEIHEGTIRDLGRNSNHGNIEGNVSLVEGKWGSGLT